MEPVLGGCDAAPFYVQQVGRCVARHLGLRSRCVVQVGTQQPHFCQPRFSQFHAFAEVTKKAANDKGDTVMLACNLGVLCESSCCGRVEPPMPRGVGVGPRSVLFPKS